MATCGKCMHVSSLTVPFTMDGIIKYNICLNSIKNQCIFELELKSSILRIFLIKYLEVKHGQSDLKLGFLTVPSTVLAALSSAHKFVFSDFYPYLHFASIFLSLPYIQTRRRRKSSWRNKLSIYLSVYKLYYQIFNSCKITNARISFLSTVVKASKQQRNAISRQVCTSTLL